MPNTFLALSMPITSAASDTSRMNGNMMRVSVAVSAALPGSNPGASVATNCGENTIPSRQMTLSTIVVSVATLLASRQAAASPPRAMVLLNVVTKAVDSAPSANRSRSRLGMRNAAVKASMAPPPPNNAAQICSRANPSSRLHITARPIIPAALVLRRSTGVCTSRAALIGAPASVRRAGVELSGGGLGPASLMRLHAARRARINTLTSSSDAAAPRMPKTATNSSTDAPLLDARPPGQRRKNNHAIVSRPSSR